VSDVDVARAITDGASTTREVAMACGAGTGCGACLPMVKDMIDDAAGSCDGCPRRAARAASPYLDNAQLREKAA
jgi:bacterioferritin-associated ferredoxin